MGKFVSLFIVMLSFIALFHASTVFKRSYYLESSDRVVLERVVDNIDHLDHRSLVELSQKLATVSESDHGILLILNQEFRFAIVFLVLCLVGSLLVLGWVAMKPLFTQELIDHNP